MANDLTPVADPSRYTAAVDAIYDTAIAPEKWPAALQAVADAFGDVGGTLTYHRSDGRLGVIVSKTLLAGQDDYNREWYRHDIRAQRMMERMYLASHTVTDRELGLEQEQDTHPFFTQFLKKYGLRHIASVHIAPDPDIYAFLSIHRAPEKPAYNREECAAMYRLGRHAEKALRLGTQLLDAESGNLALSDLFNRLNMGVFLLDGAGRVVFANGAGRRFIGDALELHDERLLAHDSADRPALESSLAAALHPARDEPAALRPLTLRRRTADTPPLAAYVLPLRAQSAGALERVLVKSQIIVLVVEVKRGEPADPALVRDLLGLTLGEARVAALIAAGLTPRDVSERLAITEGTARTVLKRVFDKAGVSRQSELAALLARAVVGGRG
jgi:DNA-binding CsgD family transcriptional regulator